jgi:hypothetical protein
MARIFLRIWGYVGDVLTLKEILILAGGSGVMTVIASFIITLWHSLSLVGEIIIGIFLFLILLGLGMFLWSSSRRKRKEIRYLNKEIIRKKFLI